MSDDPQMPELPEDGRVADATDLNWVDRFCPPWSRPYLRLSRADRPAGTWLLLIPCWWGLLLAVLVDPAGWQMQDSWIAIGCALGAFLMRGAGCTWNDISDRHIDAKVARTRSRPLPSGQVTPKQAAVWMLVQATLAFCILLTFNRFAILLGVLALAPVAIYPFAKRFTWWPQVFLGVAFNWGILLAWGAHAGGLSFAPILLYMAGISWTLFYDTIYAHQDIEDDALIGVKSTARLFAEHTPRWLLGFQIATMMLMLFAVVSPSDALVLSASPMRLVLVLAGIWVFGAHLTWQLRRLDIHDPQVCMHLFRANRDAGLLLCAVWVLALMFLSLIHI